MAGRDRPVHAGFLARQPFPKAALAPRLPVWYGWWSRCLRRPRPRVCKVVMMVFMRRPVVLALLAMGLVACSEGDDSSSKTDDTQKDARPEVSVHKVSRGPVENIAELPGRVQSVRVAEIRARVDGVVERTLYQEGTDVEAGDPLVRIDPRELQARLDSAEAIRQRGGTTPANAPQDPDPY